MTGRLGAIMTVLLLVIVSFVAARAQEGFPNRPIRVVNPYSVGSVLALWSRPEPRN
jgi:tripartite-type tricarboxylate transporter receptor subunit TctC